MATAPKLPSKDALRLKPIGLILPQSLTNSQLSRLSRLSHCLEIPDKNIYFPGNYEKIINTCQVLSQIKQHRLTDTLELLEQRGITGDTALFVIGCLQQSLEVAS